MELINTYVCPDGRVRAYCKDEKGKHKVVSYPRILMEEKLGRPLKPNEDVHHKDGNMQNNDISNLEVVLHGLHQHLYHSPQKYFDKMAICDVCGKEFLWTAKRQQWYYTDLKRGHKRVISCSRSCSSLLGRLEQLGRNV